MGKNKINTKNAKLNDFLSKCRKNLQSTLITSKITLSDIRDIVSIDSKNSNFFDDYDIKPTRPRKTKQTNDSFVSEDYNSYN